MRRILVAGNWKMYTNPQEARALTAELVKGISGSDHADMLVCPPFTSLGAALIASQGSKLAVGGQNIFWEDEGAFTGEISSKMLLTIGCSYVILGHSERRQHFFETDISVNQKLKKALQVGLIPIVCVGETLDEREAGQMKDVIKSQILGAFDSISVDDFKKAVVAYEPVWAIGTGKTATPDQAQDVHELIRGWLREKYADAVDQTRVLYGGSVKPDNAADLFSQPDIDGGLIGGASLKADSFLKIYDTARS